MGDISGARISCTGQRCKNILQSMISTKDRREVIDNYELLTCELQKLYRHKLFDCPVEGVE